MDLVESEKSFQARLQGVSECWEAKTPEKFKRRNEENEAQFRRMLCDENEKLKQQLSVREEAFLIWTLRLPENTPGSRRRLVHKREWELNEERSRRELCDENEQLLKELSDREEAFMIDLLEKETYFQKRLQDLWGHWEAKALE